MGVVYRKTEKSIGLSYRNQEYISTDGHGNYLLPAPDEYIDGRFVCNSWEVYSPRTGRFHQASASKEDSKPKSACISPKGISYQPASPTRNVPLPSGSCRIFITIR